MDVKTANALHKRVTALSQITRSTESLSGGMISNPGSTASSTATATHTTTHLRNGFAAEMEAVHIPSP